MIRLPDYPLNGTPQDIKTWADQFARMVEQEVNNLQIAAKTGYTVTNNTSNRSLNVATATLNQVAQVLGTLITDFKNKGTLG